MSELARSRARLAVLGTAALTAASLAQALPAGAAGSALAQPNPKAVKRGAYLVDVGSCDDCHTPWVFDPARGAPRPDMIRRLSGHPAGAPGPASKLEGHDIGVIGPTFTSFLLPFGVVFAPNLTPDQDTGMGTWTEEMFVRALKTGRHLGSPSARPILPPMPWEHTAKLEDADLKAMFAFLRTLPPIRNPVPDHQVPAEVLEQMRRAADQAQAAPPKPPSLR
jgi:hypothetical protein